jgi:hypothetical protein
MQKCKFIAAFLILLSFGTAVLFAEDDKSHPGAGWAVDVKAGTLGFGADLNRSIVPQVLNLRIGASFYTHSVDIDEDDINYDSELTLGAIPIALDVFPFKNWFRLGGGILINMNEVTGTARPTGGTLQIGGTTYPVDEFGQLNGKVKFNRVAPYVGFGFNNPIKKKGHWGFFTDLGLFFHGSPNLNLNPSRSVPQALQADIDEEEQEVNDDIKDYKIFPVIQLGVSYKF